MDFMYQAIMGSLLVVVIIGVFQGFGENRKIIIYSNYDDLGLTFLVPASFALIMYIAISLGLNPMISLIIGSTVSIIIALKVIVNTYVVSPEKTNIL